MSSTLRQKIKGSITATVGYLLSPLSWWNDLYVNIPIAFGLAWIVGLFSKNWFGPAMVIFYWLTNLLGLLLLHRGVAAVVKDDAVAGQLRRRIGLDILLSLIYTGLMGALIYAGILNFPGKE